MTSTKHLALKLLSLILVVLGGSLAIGGGWLASLGGSWYYLLSGVATFASGLLLWRRRHLALRLYLLVLAATLAWALMEVGLDFWQLVPRIGLPLVVALSLCVPSLRSALIEPVPSPSVARYYPALPGAVFAAVGVVVVIALARPQFASMDVALPASPARLSQTVSGAAGWREYGATSTGTRYSTAAAITPDNAHRLALAWEYRTGDVPARHPDSRSAALFEATPILVDDTLFLCTPRNIVIALDADTGKERWRHDPDVDETGLGMLVCRGVAFHEARSPVADCPRRILLGTVDGRLLALDATTGQPCPGFGQGGAVSLREGLGDVPPGFQSVTSPPSVVGDTVIVGGAVPDNVSTDMPGGVVRAYDAISGRLLWAWDAGRPAESGPLEAAEVYPRGSPNAWTVFSADPALGLVYVPTGNAAADYYGVQRTEGFDRHSSSVVALEAATGRLRWSFQTVHHDLWDYDLGSQPVLVDLPAADDTVPALILPTKTGEVFLLDRRDGRALATIEEKPVPHGDVPGERYSPTQPVSAGMPGFAPQPLTEADMWGATQLDQLLCRIEFRSRRYEGRFTPPSVTPTIQYPGNFGVMDWGSVAIDEERRVMIVNASYMPFLARLVPRAEAQAMEASGGVRRFSALLPMNGTPYAIEYGPFLSPLGLPCNAPPWGTLAAVDLDTRRMLWERPLGTSRDQAPLGIPIPGVFSLGGAAVTKAGVIFIAATVDNYLRAFDTTTGSELWKGRLPAGGQASTMTYVSPVTGRQYVVIAAGGHPHLGTTPGDHVIAFALPE
jgi:quinoprotein glucose dehydrogenase/quinate dehydrogenase (quinone)